jgi:hypothetical protein
MSRNLEKTPKTKFKKTQSEEKVVEKVKHLPKNPGRVQPRGFDMWEIVCDEGEDDEEVMRNGC